MRRFAVGLSIGLAFTMFVWCGGSEAPVPSPTPTDSGSASSASSAGGATSSSGAASSSGATSSSSGATSSSSGVTSSSSSTGGPAVCNPKCTTGRECCDGQCVNLGNDPMNCGACGTACKGDTPYCDGKCTKAPCQDGNVCAGTASCCGNTCCKADELCCRNDGPVSGLPKCFAPTEQQKTCPQGCAPLCVSDRDKKHDFAPVNPRDVLESVSRLPMTTWSYKDDPRGTRHLGPMAQDFKAELKLGGTDRAYESLDAHGVALTSIQALYQMMQEQNARITALEEENRKLRDRAR